MNHQDILTIEQLLRKIIKEEAATKEDLKQFATKDDFKNFATKDDIANIREEMQQFATKEDLKQFATKEDLQHFATKEDLRQEVGEAVGQIISAVEKGKADRADVTALEKRVTKLESVVFSPKA